MTSGNQQKPIAVPAFVKEKPGRTLDPGLRSRAYGKTERVGEGPTQLCRGVAVVGGLMEPGSGQSDDLRLAHLDLNVLDVVIHQKTFAFDSCAVVNPVRDLGIRLDSNPNNHWSPAVRLRSQSGRGRCWSSPPAPCPGHRAPWELRLAKSC
jgi:hypothetical protein